MNNKKYLYSKEDLLLCSNGKLFHFNSPRLPIKNMLMIDRITKINSSYGKYKSGFVKSELDIFQKMWFFNYHFIDDPIMPGCFFLEGMWQTLVFYLGWIGCIGKARAIGVNYIKFFQSIFPDYKKIVYQISIKKILNKSLLIAYADGKVFYKNIMICKALNLKVVLIKN